MSSEQPQLEVHELQWPDYDKATILAMEGLMRILGREFDLETYEEAIKSDRTHVLVVEEDDQIIGTATVNILVTPAQRKGYLDEVAVLEEHEGRGVGRLLLKAVESITEQTDIHTTYWTSSPKRERANAFYQKYYEEIDTSNYRYRPNSDE